MSLTILNTRELPRLKIYNHHVISPLPTAPFRNFSLVSLIYYEACLRQTDATNREKYFKTYYGRMFLKGRLKSYLTG